MHALNLDNIIDPVEETVAYESLWALEGMTDSKMSELFKSHRGFPSEVLNSLAASKNNGQVEKLKQEVQKILQDKRGQFSVCINGDFQYPQELRKPKNPLELFYYKGDLDLIRTRSLSIVGARSCSAEGQLRAQRITKELVQAGFTIISGLAKGVDTVAHQTAIKSGGKTIAVIGTPIDESYPPENSELQNLIADKHLLISQVPFYRHAKEPFNEHKYNFPKRNITMAAISEGTVIVEASDTSGSLTQARACVQLGKKLFILDSCFKNAALKWPHHYLGLGAIRVYSTLDILNNFSSMS
ncbi:MAG: DNA-processing protein DprA [Pseudomonadota bacterium]